MTRGDQRRPTAPVAVLTHGSGSTADFVQRALGPALLATGWATHPLQDRSGSVQRVEEALDHAIRTTQARLAAGVSLGAHAVARWAASEAGRTSNIEALLLVLPAWTGPPEDVATLSDVAAAEIERLGLAEACRQAEDGSWVGEELAKAWPTYGSALADVLRATSRSPGPTWEELGRIQVPVGLVAFVGDSFHPVEVARGWAATLPQAGLVELEQDAPASDRAVLGQAALEALGRAGFVSP